MSMHAIADICVIPTTGELSFRVPVARAHELLRETGLEVSLHAYGTNVAGPLTEILAAIERVHTVLHAEGVALAYPTLTAFCRRHGIGVKPKRCRKLNIRESSSYSTSARTGRKLLWPWR